MTKSVLLSGRISQKSNSVVGQEQHRLKGRLLWSVPGNGRVPRAQRDRQSGIGGFDLATESWRVGFHLIVWIVREACRSAGLDSDRSRTGDEHSRCEVGPEVPAGEGRASGTKIT